MGAAFGVPLKLERIGGCSKVKLFWKAARLGHLTASNTTWACTQALPKQKPPGQATAESHLDSSSLRRRGWREGAPCCCYLMCTIHDVRKVLDSRVGPRDSSSHNSIASARGTSLRAEAPDGASLQRVQVLSPYPGRRRDVCIANDVGRAVFDWEKRS